MPSPRWNNSTQVTSATSTICSSTPTSENSANKNNILRKKGLQGTNSQSVIGSQSNNASFLSNGTHTSQTNPTYQYYSLKNQSAIPASIILRNQHIYDKTRRRQWRNHPAPLLKTTLEIFIEEEVQDSPRKHGPNPIERKGSDSDVSALSSNDSDDTDIQSDTDNSHESSFMKSSKRRCVIYSKEHNASLHASWNNLTDLIQSLHSDLITDAGKQEWFHDPRYESMKARVFVSTQEMQHIHNFYSKLQQQLDSDDNSVDSISLQNGEKNPTLMDPNEQNNLDVAQNQKAQEDSSFTLAIIPLHPNFLRRLPPSLNNPNSSPSKSIIPSALPPNTLLIEYTDGSLRMLPPLYKLLLKNNVINEKSFNANGIDGKDNLEADRIEENIRTKRFSDNAFNALKAAEKKNHRSSNKQNLELHHEDNVFMLLGNTNSPRNGTSFNSSFEDQPRIKDYDVFDDAWRGLKSSIDQIENDQSIAVIDNVQDSESKHEDLLLLRDEPDQNNFEENNSHSSIKPEYDNQLNIIKDENTFLKKSIAQLERLIECEEGALNNEEQELQRESSKVRKLMKEIQEIERKSAIIRSDTETLM